MRTALETLKRRYRRKKLEDSLSIGGRDGRLTDYCGSAIRSHVNDLESIKAAC
jgi:hypothetical protein